MKSALQHLLIFLLILSRFSSVSLAQGWIYCEHPVAVSIAEAEDTSSDSEASSVTSASDKQEKTASVTALSELSFCHFDSGVWYYELGEAGSMRFKLGWHHDPADHHTYYFDPISAIMKSGEQRIDQETHFFNPVRKQGNYFFDGERYFLYHPNGKIPYGAEIPKETYFYDSSLAIPLVITPLHITHEKVKNDGNTTDNDTDEDNDNDNDNDKYNDDNDIDDSDAASVKTSSDEFTKERSSPNEQRREKATPSELSKEKATPSELQREKATPSELPKGTKDNTSPKTDKDIPGVDPGKVSDPHGDDAHTHCIMKDNWPNIVSHLQDDVSYYQDCITNHCVKPIRMTGILPDEDYAANDSYSPAEKAFFIYVSPVQYRNPDTGAKHYALKPRSGDALVFAMAYASSDLQLPMHFGENSASGSDGNYDSQGGFLKSWINAVLNGTNFGGKNKSAYSFLCSDSSTTKTYYSQGMKLQYYDFSSKAFKNLSNSALTPVKLNFSAGYPKEAATQKTSLTLKKKTYENYLSGLGSPAAGILMDQNYSYRFFIPSELEVMDTPLYDTEDSCQASLLQSELLGITVFDDTAFASGSWKDSESFWLRSNPTAFSASSFKDAMLQNTQAVYKEKSRQFLSAGPDGDVLRVQAEDYEELNAVRVCFAVGG